MSTLEFVPTTKNNIIALMATDSTPRNKSESKSTQEEFTQLDDYSLPYSYSQPPKKNIDPVFHFYLGSMSVVGLFILFRMIQKN